MRRIVVILAIAFVLYYLITEPVNAADAVKDAVSAVGDGFEALVAFVRRLFS